MNKSAYEHNAALRGDNKKGDAMEPISHWEWHHDTSQGAITVHTLLAGPVLCRYWGDVPMPNEAKLIADAEPVEGDRRVAHEEMEGLKADERLHLEIIEILNKAKVPISAASDRKGHRKLLTTRLRVQWLVDQLAGQSAAHELKGQAIIHTLSTHQATCPCLSSCPSYCPSCICVEPVPSPAQPLNETQQWQAVMLGDEHIEDDSEAKDGK